MLTLFSTLISFLMGGLPKLLEFFQDRSDKKHEMALAQLQIQRELEMRKLGFEAQERVEHIKSEQLEMETKSNEKQALIGAQQAEMQAIYAHDTSLSNRITALEGASADSRLDAVEADVLDHENRISALESTIDGGSY